MKPPFATVFILTCLAWISGVTFLYYGGHAHYHALRVLAIPNLIFALLLTALTVRAWKG